MSNLMHAAGMAAPSIIQPLKPLGKDWNNIPTPQMPMESNAIECWVHSEGFAVLSAVEMAEAEGPGSPLELHYHISISKNRARCNSNDARWILSEFGCEGAEEDNHVPHGIVRNFWRPVNENRVGIECACKEDEPAIREDKGDYVWRPAS
jgi:hypothetical protein